MPTVNRRCTYGPIHVAHISKLRGTALRWGRRTLRRRPACMTYGGNLMLEAQMRGRGEQISAGGRGRDRQETGGGTQVDPSRASSLTPHTHWRGTTLVSWRGRARSPLPPLLLRRGENEVKSSEPFFVRLLRTPRGRSAAGPPRRSVRPSVRPSVSQSWVVTQSVEDLGGWTQRETSVQRVVLRRRRRRRRRNNKRIETTAPAPPLPSFLPSLRHRFEFETQVKFIFSAVG